jgi:acyl-CoA synthetase (AMP-forming)/AMP-acid ligase II
MSTGPTTLIDLLDEVVASDGTREAFVQRTAEGTQRITFAELAARSAALAQWLVDDRGVRPGDVVGIKLPSGIDYAVAYHAIVRAGAVATGINPRLGPAEVHHIVRAAGPVHMFDGPLPHLEPGDPHARVAETHPADPVAIVWTGGTTGMPKGAWFDHECLRAMTLGAAPLSAHGDRRLSPLPFAHVGFMTRAWDELSHRITTVIAPTPWTAATTLDIIGSEAVTVCQGVPTQYRLMFDAPSFEHTDTSHLRIAGIGAARIPPELVSEMRERLGCPVVVRYASTEGCVITGTRLDDPDDVVCTTVGRPNGGVEVKLFDEQFAPVADGEVGTVCVRTRAMMRGYWNEPERTAEAIDDEGWLHTGDLGWFGADGNLRLSGRRTEMYIRGGYNVYPIEVENCLGEHPAVAASAVLGTEVDDRLGEIGVLFAVARQGQHLDLADVRTFVKERLADYKAPDALVVVPELPLTSLGKVDKKVLVERAQQEAAQWSRSTPPG